MVAPPLNANGFSSHKYTTHQTKGSTFPTCWRKVTNIDGKFGPKWFVYAVLKLRFPADGKGEEEDHPDETEPASLFGSKDGEN